MRFSTALCLASCALLFSAQLAWAPSWPSAWHAPDAGSPSPLLLAIRDVESSGGRDCGPGGAGELTCWQIKPATAALMGCHPFWRVDPRMAQDCAQRWVDKGEAICRRNDTYGIARHYNRGRCMGWKAKPSAYEAKVQRALMRRMM